MRYMTLAEVLHLHRMVIARSGGSPGVRDLAGLESAIAQPQGFGLADGSVTRDAMLEWLEAHAVPDTRPA